MTWRRRHAGRTAIRLATLRSVRRVTFIASLVAASTLAVAPAHAARSCTEPGADWQSATPAEQGFDAAKLQAALDFGTQAGGASLRVYRNGCRVAADRAFAVNRNVNFESYSLAKSITSLLFGRAMTLGLISPDDPLGSLLPEADKAHGAITMRDLLTGTTGLKWVGTRDYDIFTPDRIGNALTTEVEKQPGSFFEYSQNGPALVAMAVQRAVGEDVQAFAQRELFGPLGIEPGTWGWKRDSKGATQGFFGLEMQTDDYARFGELMRRGGLWNGRRLLSQRYVRESTAPSERNGCYGWLIWVNDAKPCIGPTVSERPVRQRRYFPDLPTDTFHYEGLFGQIVTVMPTQGIIVARNGQDSPLNLAGGTDTESELYEKILAALTDGSASPPVGDGGATVRGDGGNPNPDEGFQFAFSRDGLSETQKGLAVGPLPPAGPDRARALRPRLAHLKPNRRGEVTVRVTCPARRPGRGAAPCEGVSTLTGTRRPQRYAIAPGATSILRFALTTATQKAVRAQRRMSLRLETRNADAADGTPAGIDLPVRLG